MYRPRNRASISTTISVALARTLAQIRRQTSPLVFTIGHQQQLSPHLGRSIQLLLISQECHKRLLLESRLTTSNRSKVRGWTENTLRSFPRSTGLHSNFNQDTASKRPNQCEYSTSKKSLRTAVRHRSKPLVRPLRTSLSTTLSSWRSQI